MFWKRRRHTTRPTDDQLMAVLQGRLTEMAPGFARGSRVHDGMLLGDSGWALMALPNHTGSAEHFDLGCTLDVQRGPGSIMVDCLSGIGDFPQALESVVHLWSETSGACFLELATGGTGRFADHLRAGDPAALPGWHTVCSGLVAYGPDDDANTAVQQAMLGHEVLRVIAAELEPALDRTQPNGIKIFLCRTTDELTAEVRVDGEVAEAATAALAALPWPAVPEFAFARFYAVAVHPEQARPGQPG